MKLYVKHPGHRARAATRDEVLEAAAGYHGSDLIGKPVLDSPSRTRETLLAMLAGYQHEVFGCIMLTQRHRVIEVVQLFRGTIDGASVHPREVVRSVMEHSAAAVVFYHNHPSGDPEPSQADEVITTRLREALALIDVRVLDHLVVGRDKTMSFAERGLL